MLNFLAAIGSAPAGGGGSFESIATVNGTGSSSTITFSSIPSGFQHLQIRGIARSTQAATTLGNIIIRFNGDTTNSNYARHGINSDGTFAGIYPYGNANNPILVNSCVPYNSQLSNTLGVFIVDVHDYALTTKNKTVRAFSGLNNNNTTSGSQGISIASGLWQNTNAITSISLVQEDGFNFTTTSTFALYGIKGA